MKGKEMGVLVFFGVGLTKKYAQLERFFVHWIKTYVGPHLWEEGSDSFREKNNQGKISVVEFTQINFNCR